MLDKALIEELDKSLAPRYEEELVKPELAHMRKVAHCTLAQYQASNDILTHLRGRPIRTNTDALVNKRRIDAVQNTIREELEYLARFVTDVSHLDSTMIDLSDRLNNAVAAQAREIG